MHELSNPPIFPSFHLDRVDLTDAYFHVATSPAFPGASVLTLILGNFHQKAQTAQNGETISPHKEGLV